MSSGTQSVCTMNAAFLNDPFFGAIATPGLSIVVLVASSEPVAVEWWPSSQWMQPLRRRGRERGRGPDGRCRGVQDRR